MRIIFSVMFLLISTLGFSQSVDTSKNTKSILRTPSRIKIVPAYNLDGKIITNFDNLSPDNIFDIQVLKGAQDTVKYGKNAVNGVAVITSRQFASKEIGEKLSAFSKPYEKYSTQKHPCEITYLLNGSIVPERTVFYLPKEKIKKVKFMASETNSEIKIRSSKFTPPKRPIGQVYIRGNRT